MTLSLTLSHPWWESARFRNPKDVSPSYEVHVREVPDSRGSEDAGAEEAEQRRLWPRPRPRPGLRGEPGRWPGEWPGWRAAGQEPLPGLRQHLASTSARARSSRVLVLLVQVSRSESVNTYGRAGHGVSATRQTLSAEADLGGGSSAHVPRTHRGA